LFLSKGFPRHFLILSTWASGSKSRLFSSSAKRPFETFLLDQKNGFGSFERGGFVPYVERI